MNITQEQPLSDWEIDAIHKFFKRNKGLVSVTGIAKKSGIDYSHLHKFLSGTRTLPIVKIKSLKSTINNI